VEFDKNAAADDRFRLDTGWFDELFEALAFKYIEYT
jgi:hypothetical protein